MFSSPSPAPQPSSVAPLPFPYLHNGATTATAKRKRRPAGTPDPDAEVVALSPRTLLESERYVCEICGQGFQRDQNLQMHRRRHKVPGRLLKRESGAASAAASGESPRKRVYVCPELACLHHDPAHALGDLVGIKKHFRRKHSAHRQWACGRCSKAYAVQSDFKAHLKTCGTRGHSCDCGRVFSRVESFIEHQDACNAGRAAAEELQIAPPLPPDCLSRTASCPNPSAGTRSGNAAWLSLTTMNSLELQLLPPSTAATTTTLSQPAEYYSSKIDDAHITKLQLSIGAAGDPAKVKDEGGEQLRLAMAEKALEEAQWQVAAAEVELANAKRIREQAQVELSRALVIRDQAVHQISSTLLEITCHGCKKKFQACAMPVPLISGEFNSSVVTEGEGENDN